MSIIENIFSYGTSVCMCCGNKFFSKNMEILCNEVGICRQCFKSLKFTKGEGAFEGSEYVSYVISPLYYSYKARKLIKNLKFDSTFRAVDVLSEIFAYLLEDMPHLMDFDMVTSVPLSFQRENERGYNQATLVGECVARVLDLPLYDDILKKIKNTDRQSKMSALDRLTNVKDAFCTDKDIKEKKIILVDDVYTTGNTMNSCAKELIKNGAAEVIGITAAISLKDKKYIQYKI